MSRKSIIIAAAILVVLVLAGGIAFGLKSWTGTTAKTGAWPEAVRSAFIENCVKTCRLSPAMDSSRYPLCDTACTCSAGEAEKLMTVEDLQGIYTAQQGGSMTPVQNDKMNKLKEAGEMCARQSASGIK